MSSLDFLRKYRRNGISGNKDTKAMQLRYKKLEKKPKVFMRLFGVSIKTFKGVLKKVERQWIEKIINQYKSPGRVYKLSLSDRLLALLLYYRSYITQEFIGYLFGIHNSQVSRFIKKLEPIVSSIVSITKSKKLSKEDIEVLIIDATEQTIERPKKGQRPYYSGKKKSHTIKTEVRVNDKGGIVQVSKSYPGSVHDFKVFKQHEFPSPEYKVLVDSGYQGIHKYHQRSLYPCQNIRSKNIISQEKEHNTFLAKTRIKVEHVIRNLKTFNILSYRYRNKRKRYNLKFNIIAGIVNLNNGF